MRSAQQTRKLQMPGVQPDDEDVYDARQQQQNGGESERPFAE